MSFEKSFGEKIRELRKCKGMSQADVARRINISPQAVSKWENNRSIPDMLTIMELSIIFEISIEELLTGNIRDFEKRNDENLKEKDYRVNWKVCLFLSGNFILSLLYIDFFKFEHPMVQYIIVLLLYLSLMITINFIGIKIRQLKEINVDRILLLSNILLIIILIILIVRKISTNN